MKFILGLLIGFVIGAVVMTFQVRSKLQELVDRGVVTSTWKGD